MLYLRLSFPVQIWLQEHDTSQEDINWVIVSPPGKAYYGGGQMERLPFRWYPNPHWSVSKVPLYNINILEPCRYHVCLVVSYDRSSGKAHRSKSIVHVTFLPKKLDFNMSEIISRSENIITKQSLKLKKKHDNGTLWQYFQEETKGMQ